jgi:hypothetical protein
MAKPRPPGTVVKMILASIEEWLEENQDQFFEVVLNMQEGDEEAAVKALREMSERNLLALKTVTFTRSSKLTEAQEIVFKALVERQKKGQRRDDE